LRMIAGQTNLSLPLWARFMLPAAGYIAGLILGIWGRAEVGASDRRAETLGNIAIGLNAYRLAWIVFGANRYCLHGPMDRRHPNGFLRKHADIQSWPGGRSTRASRPHRGPA
jgi:hypothetical protein